MQKIKIVWLCHFSEQDIRSRLPLSKSMVLGMIKKFTGKGDTGINSDFAPWICQMIDWFEKFDDVELHIVAPHRGLMHMRYEFEMRGIYYHFFRSDLPFGITQVMENIKPSISNYFIARRNVTKLIDEIQPDIVNLIGAENAYISSTVLSITKFPVMVTLQTVYANPERAKYSDVNQLAWNNELNIFKKERFYAASNINYANLVEGYHKGAYIFKFTYPNELPKLTIPIQKHFDFVFFSISLTSKKGADDAIEALALVKNRFENISLKMVGNETPERMVLLKNRVRELGLEYNIEFIPSFELQSDLFKYIAEARFALLPVKLDFIPGTVLQSMSLGLPVVTYATLGTPTINEEKECVLIAPIENREALAKNMIKLLDSPELAQTLAKNSLEFVQNNYNNEKAMRRLVDDYRSIVRHCKERTEIPLELLYNLNK